MYKAFYNFDCEPFDTQPDPTFLWLGEKYKEALSILRYGILDNKGFLLLSGEAGTGKTTLLNSLVQSLGDDVLWTIIPNPSLQRMDFFNAIADGFKLSKQYTSKVEFMLDFGTFLQNANDNHKKVLLIIDSAHLLTQENIEELRLLSNIEKADTKLINIFFIAQPSFSSLLTKSQNSALRQRLSLNFTIDPLSVQETSEYIQHRLRIAGVENRLITDKAVRAIHQYSGGIPRKINVLCQQVFADGANQGRKVIDQGAVQECMNKISQGSISGKFDFQKSIAGKNKYYSKNKPVNRQFVSIVTGIIIFGCIAFWGFPYLDKVFFGPQDLGTTPIASKSKSENIEKKEPGHSEKNTASLVKNELPKKEIAKAENALIKEPEKATGNIQIASNDKNNPENNKANDQKKIPSLQENEEIKTDIQKAKTASQSETIAQKSLSDKGGISTTGANVTGKPISMAIEEKAQISGEKGAVQENKDLTVKKNEPQQVEFKKTMAILPLQANSTGLTSFGDKELDKFLHEWKSLSRFKIEVRGYVSAKENSEENIKLSLTRADAIKKLLEQKGIASEKIVVKGMGNQEPLASNDTAEGRNKNRRVEVEIIQ